ncbi:DUF3078 domain-containing protein [Lutibacter sp. HS1-25]|uniref:DUF3078 domain-containing protein n=1 Tax=Lutibacter sp. HS1-25 TaxID=2485000 RepID=UPI001011E86D|nr:DUF3078 domain-containing protein [Lutibacter sp. HS1-25]RXP64512.1 DUF3078 domain-containing protein [Lutibacter sp. HS1-25]
MKKRILLVLTLLCFTFVFAQEKEKDTTYWSKSGKITFLFNQSAFSNWVAGGDNSIAGNITGNYEFNYKKNNLTWNNRIDAAYGLSKTGDADYTRKTDDNIQLNSLIGNKLKGYWSYSFFLNFKTQFAKGYKYSKDDLGIETREKYTNFMSPGYLAFGPGFLWEKSENFKFNLSPVAARFTFVDKNFTLPNNAYFGVDEGKSSLFELGARASGYAKFTLFENVVMENAIALYSNYLNKPQNVDIDYTMNINMKINSFLSTNLTFQTIYDDNAYAGFQIREVFGLGINYIY